MALFFRRREKTIMRFLKSGALLLFATTLLFSCVSRKKFDAANAEISRLQQDSANLQNNLYNLQNEIKTATSTLNQLQENKLKLENELKNLNQSLQQTKQSATEQIMSGKETIAAQQQRLQQLQRLIDEQKQQTEMLRKKMADALTNFNANELTVSTKDGKVYVSLQENLLFPSGSAVVNPKGKQALSQLAQVLNTNPDIRVNIEGHTDSIPIHGRFEDNWALSVARATSIVRILTNDYKVNPERITASGRSQYEPVDVNYTSQGRAKNRRTEIILEPNLDKVMELLNSPTGR